MRYGWMVVLFASMVGVTHAQTAYKCAAGGQTSYQQAPCAANQKQQTIRLADPGPAVSSAPTAGPPAAVTDDTPAPPPSEPTMPPPRMYGCIRATDGKPYTSANGDPQPYLAPLGVLGAVTPGLSQTYGNPNSAVASAPELNRGKGNVAAIATSNYVWVQDTCRELSPAETCQALRDEAEANQKAIRNAFKSERAPLDARDATLRAQLVSCR